jgi:hypothetical protein
MQRDCFFFFAPLRFRVFAIPGAARLGALEVVPCRFVIVSLGCGRSPRWDLCVFAVNNPTDPEKIARFRKFSCAIPCILQMTFTHYAPFVLLQSGMDAVGEV